MDPSRIAPTSPLGRALRLPLRLIPPGTVVRVLRGRLRGKRWIAGSSNHGCWLGTYEHAKRRAFERHVAAGSVVLDIGSHVGFYALLASVLVGPGGRVFAFEPLPANLSYLRRHLELNRIDNVSVLECAVSDASGVSSFREGANRHTGRIDPRGDLRVETVSLDELVAAGEVPLPDCIKVDVEGAEAPVLEGARATLERSRATVFLATHGAGRQRECRRLLESLGYRIRSLDDDPVERSSELLAVAARSV